MKRLIAFLVALAGMQTPATGAVVGASHTMRADATSFLEVVAGIVSIAHSDDNRQAQTFTTTSAGWLSSISFNLSRDSTATADLQVELTSFVGGQPDQVLQTFVVPMASTAKNSPSFAFLKAGQFTNTVTMAKESSILLAQDTQYALVFSTKTAEGSYRIPGVSSLDGPGYGGGSLLSFQDAGPYINNPSWDLFFQVAVEPIPEPGAVMLSALTASVLLGHRRRHPRPRRAAPHLLLV